MAKRVKYLIITLTLVELFILILCLIPLSIETAAIGSLGFPLAITIHLLLLSYGFLNSKEILLASGLGFLGLFWLFPHLYSFNFSKTESEKPSIEIMTYNLDYLRYVILETPENAEKRWEDFFQNMADERKPDILCVQETSSASYIPISKKLQYSHYYGSKGTMIFAKQPFLNKGYLDFGEHTNNACTWVDLELFGEIVRVFNVHLESNRLKKTRMELEAENAGYIDQLKKMIKVYFNAAKLRHQQTHLLKKVMEDSPYPIILSGDFNAPPVSENYRILKEGLKDAFLERGIGFGQSYSKLPFLRIDYVLCNPNFQILNYKTIKGAFSDHYAVKVELTNTQYQIANTQ